MTLTNPVLKLLWLGAFALTLTACGGGGGGGGGTSSDLTGAVPTSVTPTQNPPSTGVVPSKGSTAPSMGADGLAAPQISGDPVTAVHIGEAYDFEPEVSDMYGDQLVFAVANLPSWAQFDASTGRLSGTPTQADIGSFYGISISVANSVRSASLKPFSITVTQIGTGSATVSWLAPTRNTDGTTLVDLKGFQIYFGRSVSKLNQSVKISNASISRYVVDNLSRGTWYFAVSAKNSHGIHSALSGIGSKVIN